MIHSRPDEMATRDFKLSLKFFCAGSVFWEEVRCAQGYLAHKKPRPPMTLRLDYA